VHRTSRYYPNDILKSSVRLCGLAYICVLFVVCTVVLSHTSALETRMDVHRTLHTSALETEAYIHLPNVRLLQRLVFWLLSSKGF
jgi:hypothetical protein